MRKKVDFLVIGSGIAGLSYALKVADHGKVCILSKSSAEETATKYAQGGIAAVMYAPDTYEKHISDTIVAGDVVTASDSVAGTIHLHDSLTDDVPIGICVATGAVSEPGLVNMNLS